MRTYHNAYRTTTYLLHVLPTKVLGPPRPHRRDFPTGEHHFIVIIIYLRDSYIIYLHNISQYYHIIYYI